MRFWILAAPVLSVLALTSATAAMAQVSAQEVWDSWKANFGDESNVAIGSETLEGGVLTVTGLTVTATDDESISELVIPTLVLTEQGDGTVSVTMAEEIPITVIFDANDDRDAMSIAAAIRQTGLEMLIGGTPEAMTHDLSAERIAFDLDSAEDGNATLSGSLAFNTVNGRYVVETDGMQAVDSALAAELIEVTFSSDNPDAGTAARVEGTVDGIDSSFSGIMPLPEDFDPETALSDGMAGEGGYVYGPSAFSFDITDQNTPVTGTINAEGGSLDIVASGESFGYSSQTIGLALSASSPAMPFPIDLSLAQAGIDFLVPLSASEEPVDFALGLNLTDLAVNDDIWAMFDPTAMLPRDPATLVVDLTGTARLFADLTDPEQAEALVEAAAPGEVHSISLNDLTIAFGGARVTGTGAFTFDNADVTTIPGIPRPEGRIDLAATGLNKFIDTLAAMGILPQEQVMGARMMLGVFAVPTGDDQLSSTLEINAEGQVLANGQRIQ